MPYKVTFLGSGNWDMDTLGCGGRRALFSLPQANRNFMSTTQNERNPVCKTSSAGPQGHVRAEEGLDLHGVIECGEEMGLN